MPSLDEGKPGDVEVVRAEGLHLLDDGSAEAVEDGGDRGDDHDADEDAEDREERPQLVPPEGLERHEGVLLQEDRAVSELLVRSRH